MKRIFLLLLLFAVMGCGQKSLDYGPYSIGRDINWFPLEMGQKRPSLNGFTNALVHEIAKTENLPLEIIDISWTQLFQSMEKDEVAGIFTSLSPNVVTEDLYTFSEPIVLLGPVLVVRENSPVTSIDEMSGKIVAAYQYDESVLVAQKNPNAIIHVYQNMPAILGELDAGKVDGVLMPNLIAQTFVPSIYPGQLKIATSPLNNKAIRLITLQGKHDHLIKYFNQGLATLRKKSSYTKLREEFNLY